MVVFYILREHDHLELLKTPFRRMSSYVSIFYSVRIWGHTLRNCHQNVYNLCISTRTMLWNSDNSVSIVVADLKHFSLFEINRSTHVGLLMPLKQVFSFTIFFASWEFRNSDNTVSVSSLLKSPARKKLAYFSENRSKQLLKFW